MPKKPVYVFIGCLLILVVSALLMYGGFHIWNALEEFLPDRFSSSASRSICDSIFFALFTAAYCFINNLLVRVSLSPAKLIIFIFLYTCVYDFALHYMGYFTLFLVPLNFFFVLGFAFTNSGLKNIFAANLVTLILAAFIIFGTNSEYVILASGFLYFAVFHFFLVIFNFDRVVNNEQWPAEPGAIEPAPKPAPITWLKPLAVLVVTIAVLKLGEFIFSSLKINLVQDNSIRPAAEYGIIPLYISIVVTAYCFINNKIFRVFKKPVLSLAGVLVFTWLFRIFMLEFPQHYFFSLTAIFLFSFFLFLPSQSLKGRFAANFILLCGLILLIVITYSSLEFHLEEEGMQDRFLTLVNDYIVCYLGLFHFLLALLNIRNGDLNRPVLHVEMPGLES